MDEADGGSKCQLHDGLGLEALRPLLCAVTTMLDNALVSTDSKMGTLDTNVVLKMLPRIDAMKV